MALQAPSPDPQGQDDGKSDEPVLFHLPGKTRSRGLTVSSQNSPQKHTPPLRSHASIPTLRSHSKTVTGPLYRVEVASLQRDSSQSSIGRDRMLIRDPHQDELRTSYRSAFTTASSSIVDTSATERSSVFTKRSSVSDARLSYAAQAGPEEEGMSVEDAIDMYEFGFSDEAEEVSGMPSPPPDSGQPPLIDSVTATETLPAPSISNGPPSPPREPPPNPPVSERSLTPPPQVFSPSRSFHTRSSTQIIAGKTVSIFTAPQASVVPRDRYGFKKATQNVTTEQYDAWDLLYSDYLERRRHKWYNLMRHFDLPTENPTRFPPRSDKVKRYIRKGIPPAWRGAAWFWYAGGQKRLAKQGNLYWDLVERAEQGKLSEADREQIERDLNRTFPDNIKFKPDAATGLDHLQSAMGDSETETPILKGLRRILQAFAIHNPKIGYCQSLNFLAGLLLLFLDEDEEKAFVMLDIITTEHLPGTHSNVLEANIDIGVLMGSIKESMPAVWAKIDDTEEIAAGSGNGASASARLPTVALATTSWFMSIFIGTLPVETVLRVWDSFFYEGSKTLFRIALAVFKLGEGEIRAVSDPMEIFQVVQTIPRRLVDANILMEACYRRRNGFGHLSQDTIDAKRAQRRRIHAADIAKRAGSAATDERTRQPSTLRRAASRARLKRSQSKRHLKGP